MGSSNFLAFMPFAAVLLLIIGIIVLMLIFHKKRLKTIINFYSRLAKELQLTMIRPEVPWYREPYPIVRGEHQGRSVEIQTIVKGHGKHTYYYTHIAIETQHERHNLRLTKEYLMSKIGRSLFGMQDIQINDSFFDNKFIIKSDDEIFAKRFFNTEIKSLLTDIHSGFTGQISIEPYKIFFSQIYQIDSQRNYDWTVQVVDVLYRIANRVEDLD